MAQSGNGFTGYRGVWARVDLTNRKVKPRTGRSRDLSRLYRRARRPGPAHLRPPPDDRPAVKDPLRPQNRIILGTGALNDTAVPTAGRGSCSFISPMTRSPGPRPGSPATSPSTAISPTPAPAACSRTCSSEPASIISSSTAGPTGPCASSSWTARSKSSTPRTSSSKRRTARKSPGRRRPSRIS